MHPPKYSGAPSSHYDSRYRSPDADAPQLDDGLPRSARERQPELQSITKCPMECGRPIDIPIRRNKQGRDRSPRSDHYQEFGILKQSGGSDMLTWHNQAWRASWPLRAASECYSPMGATLAGPPFYTLWDALMIESELLIDWDPEDFCIWLEIEWREVPEGEVKGGLATNTVRRRVDRAREFFNLAVRREVIAANPFSKESVTMNGSLDRQFFVPADSIERLIVCPSNRQRGQWGTLENTPKFTPLNRHNTQSRTMAIMAPQGLSSKTRKPRFPGACHAGENPCKYPGRDLNPRPTV